MTSSVKSLMGVSEFKSSVGEKTGSVGYFLAPALVRPVCFPSVLRARVESLLFSSVFLAAGYVSLGHSMSTMPAPMVPVVFIMMMSMVLSGVYRAYFARKSPARS